LLVQRRDDRAEARRPWAAARLRRQDACVTEDAVCGLPGIDVAHAREPTTIGLSLQDWRAAARTHRHVCPSAPARGEAAVTKVAVPTPPCHRDRPPRVAEDANRFLTAAQHAGRTFRL
jgi:hypothetical protein